MLALNLHDLQPFSFLLILAAIPVVIPILVYVQVTKASEPESMLTELPGALSPTRQQYVDQHAPWLESQGYQYLTAFQFSALQVVVFQQVNAPRYFSIIFGQKVSYDLVSMFDDEHGLTTATSNAIGMFPIPPGSFKQGFPGISADVALQKHLESEAYLTKKFQIAWQPVTKSYEQIVLDGIRKQMSYVRSLPLWPLRSLNWYFVTRKKMANLSVQQQFP